MTSPSRMSSHLEMQLSDTNNTGASSPNFSMSVSVPALGYESYPGPCGDSSDSRSPELPPLKASDRESRIFAEKQRRSQYNAQISQMMTLVSDVVHSQRKVDKTSVLRLAANQLRNEHVFGDTIKCGHTETWSNALMKVFDLFGGFMIAITCRGRIFNVSPNVQEKLGYCHVDLLGQDIYNYIHPEDKEILCQHIYPPQLQTGCDQQVFEQHHNFHVRIIRAGARTEPPRYERCRIDGQLRRSDRATANGVQDEQIIRRQRVRHHRTFSSSGNDFVFIGMVHIVVNNLPVKVVSPTAYSEYWTRHLIDGRIVQCDQSISLVSGYMTDEVTGTCAFVFMHKDDVRWVICVLRQMYDQNKEFGETYYRLLSRTGHFIYMRTRGFLEIDRKTKKVQSFVCVNSVVSEEYGHKMMKEMKRKYSVMVNSIVDDQTKKGVAVEEAVENPKKLERIVMHLVEPPHNESPDVLQLVAPSKENIITAIINSEKAMKGAAGLAFESRKRKMEIKPKCTETNDLKRPMLGFSADQ